MTEISLLLENFAYLFIESAPWLMLGLLIAGIMHEWVPLDILQKHMGNNSISAIGKSAIIGAPLPLCSCGVIPAAVGLRRSGASKPATVSFLVSTPETGVDSVSVSYALLGPLFAIIRPISAVVSAFYAGLMVKWFDTPEQEKCTHSGPTSESCCDTALTQAQTASCSKAVTTPPPSCCASQTKHDSQSTDCSTAPHAKGTHQNSNKVSISSKIIAVWQFASGKLLTDITLWLLIGLALAAAIKTWVPTDFLTQWGDGFMAMLVMAIIGIPMYICATASTPLAVGFLSAGLSPGAVLVFLLAGPATNISTMGMIAKEMGTRTLILYVSSVISASILLGYCLNALVSQFQLTSWVNFNQSVHSHHDISAFYALSGVILFVLMLRNTSRSLRKRWVKPEVKSCCH